MALFRPWRDWPWALKLAILLVAVAIVPLTVLTVAGAFVSGREVVSNNRARDLQRAQATASHLNRYLQDVVADATIAALAPETLRVLQNPDEEASRRELTVVLENAQKTKRLDALFVLDHGGTIIVATDPALVGRNRIAAPFFLSAVAGQRGVHQPRYLADDGAVHINVSVPVYDARDRLAGVVATRISLDEIDRLVAGDTNFSGMGEFGVLWDELGIVLSSPARAERRLRPLGALLPITRDRLIAEHRFGPDTAALLADHGRSDSLVQHARWQLYDERADPHHSANLGDGRLYVASVPLRDQRWTYAIAVPEARLLAAIRAETRRNLAVASGAALLAVALAIGAARWLSRSLSRVGDVARALAAGDMRRRVHLGRRDEIGQMADAFDTMADALAQKDAELRRDAETLERRVQERTAELRGLLSAIPDLIFKISADGRLLEYVAPKDEVLALPPGDFLGRHLADVLPPNVAVPSLDALERVRAGQGVEPYEYRMPLGGEMRHFEARMSASGSDAAVAVVRDVTERRRAEERIRFLARAGTLLTSSLDYGNVVETLAGLAVPLLADVCVVETIDQGHLQVAAVAGDPSQQEVAVRAVRGTAAAVGDTDRPASPAFASGPPHLITRTSASLQDDSPAARLLTALDANSLIVAPLMARGQNLGVMTFVSTSPDRRYGSSDLALVEELAHRAGIALDNARLYRELQESSRLKDEFLGIVSHELRTPLNALLGWTQVLRRGGWTTQEIGRALAAIDRNARAQAQLVEDLLDTSRMVSGKLRIDLTWTNVEAVIDAANESFRPIAAARGLELTVDVAPELPMIPADAARLQQIIGNLLSNALKFTPAGGHVRLSALLRGGELEIRVADDGVGISPEFLPYVFDRFRQADSTTTRMHGGLGIGLAIARHLVELHGGTIVAESGGEARGAAFTVRLPTVPASEPRAERGRSADGVAPLLTGIRVLVVDDDADARELLETTITSAGGGVDTAGSVHEALERLDLVRPDVLLADIGMPGQDGYTLIRRVREQEAARALSRLPAVALTAYARDEDRTRSYRAGFDRHLAKPADPVAVVRTIADLAPKPNYSR